MSPYNEKKNVSFAAIDQYVESNIVLPTEKVTHRNFVEWGEGNNYPNYLLDLYNNVSTLRSIINGNIDYVTGDDITILPLHNYGDGVMNLRGDQIYEQVRNIVKDYNIYGGFALQIIRDHNGDVAEIYYIDMRFLRSNKENDVFYYNEHWEKGGKKDVILYPKFIGNLNWATMSEEERNRHASSILYVKNVHTQVYPAPLYAAAIKACEIERCIDNYHLNSIENGFTSSVIVNFNNGDPGDDIKKEIEEEFTEKFSGHQNAGRILFSWNKSKDSEVTIGELKTEDFGAKYDALSKHSRQQIFTAFRANPNLFGIPTEGNGFANEQYEESFTLYNRTQIEPIQKVIKMAYDKIYGIRDVMTIVPFSMGDADAATSLASQLGVGGTQSMMAVLESTTMTLEQKKGTLQVLFGLDEESSCKILNIPYIPQEEEVN